MRSPCRRDTLTSSQATGRPFIGCKTQRNRKRDKEKQNRDEKVSVFVSDNIIVGVGAKALHPGGTGPKSRLTTPPGSTECKRESAIRSAGSRAFSSPAGSKHTESEPIPGYKGRKGKDSPLPRHRRNTRQGGAPPRS